MTSPSFPILLRLQAPSIRVRDGVGVRIGVRVKVRVRVRVK
jgi:hypothetical protein